MASERGKIEHFEWFTYEQLEELAASSGLLVQNLRAALPALRPHLKGEV
jgi:hypothetical protein